MFESLKKSCCLRKKRLIPQKWWDLKFRLNNDTKDANRKESDHKYYSKVNTEIRYTWILFIFKMYKAITNTLVSPRKIRRLLFIWCYVFHSSLLFLLFLFTKSPRSKRIWFIFHFSSKMTWKHYKAFISNLYFISVLNLVQKSWDILISGMAKIWQ